MLSMGATKAQRYANENEVTVYINSASPDEIVDVIESDIIAEETETKDANCNDDLMVMIMYKNFRIYNTGNTFVVRADSKRFGKQAIVFESWDVKECVKWIYKNYRNKAGEIITNSRWTTRVYSKAMSTCDIPNNPWYSLARA